jgi:hypothetical protein
MKHFRSEYAFQKYRPYLSWRKRILRFFHKKQYIIAPPQNSFHYKANPFKAQKKSKSFKIKIIILAILLAAWIACIAYIPYFKINKADYYGLNNTKKSEMDEFVYQNFLNKKNILPLSNYFFINTGKISNELYKKFAFETVKTVKIFPSKLNITVEEKISSIIYDNGKKYFLLDDAGTAIKYLKDVETYEVTKIVATTNSANLLISNATSTHESASTTEHTPDFKKINQLFGNYPIIYDRRGLDVEVKQKNIIPSQHISAVIAWRKALAEQGITESKFFILDNINSGIKIDTFNSWNILFQPKDDALTQINNLKNILPSINPKEYIDLRFGEKIYWK